MRRWRIWLRAAARLLRPAGTVTLIWRADGLAEVLAALAAEFGAVSVLPIHPKPGMPAIRVLVRAAKGPWRAACRCCRALCLPTPTASQAQRPKPCCVTAPSLHA